MGEASEVPMRSVLADILSKFDGQQRRGINFHLTGIPSAYNSMCDTRHVHFGIDDGYLSDREDRGKPWPDKCAGYLPGGKPAQSPHDVGRGRMENRSMSFDKKGPVA